MEDLTDNSLSDFQAGSTGYLPETEEINEFHTDTKDIFPDEWENIDPLTGFYLKKYGRIAAKRMGRSDHHKLVFSSIINIVNYDALLEKYGQVFCNALIEEAAVIIRRIFPKDQVIYRNSVDEFVIVVLTDSREESEKRIRQTISEIENIYSDSGIAIECTAGANIRENDDPFETLKSKTHFAAATAKKFKARYGNFLFYDEAEKDGYAHPDIAQGGDIAQSARPAPKRSATASFAFKIFEKTADFDAAIGAFMRKIGRVLDLERILLFELNRDNSAIKIAYQWHADGVAPIEKTSFSPGKARFDMIERRMKMNDFLPSDRTAYEKYAAKDGGNISGKGAVYSFQMFDGSDVIGCVVYELKASLAENRTISDLNGLTGIVSAHFARSKTSRESRAKSEFFSKMSHEIRTPMNVIIGMTKIALEEEGIPEKTADCLKKIDRASHYLLSLINDILDISRIESGKMTVEETYIDLEELLDGVDTMIRIQTDAKGIWLRSEKNIPCRYLLGDPLKLNQILINIMGNAVKFTDKGGITLSVSQTEPSPREVCQVTFSIKDTGVGISEENIGRIFNSFEQANETVARVYGGTGLGLSISKNLVELLGGRLEVKSQVGKGTEFFFTIPMKVTVREEDTSGNDDTDSDISSKRLLVAEDDELNREIIKTLLEKENMLVELAENGLEAVNMFEKAPDGHYDAILMDIRMPVMDGIEAAKRIRNSGKPDGLSVPVIAMTANAYDDDARLSAESGMNGHLTKPVDIKKVMSELRRVIPEK